MKMKATLLATFAALLLLGRLLPPSLLRLLAFLVVAGFALLTTWLSLRQGLPYYHDFPNVLRVVLAVVGALRAVAGDYVCGVVLLGLAILLNDEWQRRAFRRVIAKRRGILIAFLGIDGSGKSTHAEATVRWLRELGIPAQVVPYHRYLFVDRLALALRRGRRLGPSLEVKGPSTMTPSRLLRLWLSFIDNLLYFLITSIPAILQGRVIIYDRFIWSTFIKYEALGYPAELLKRLSFAIRPTFALIFDIPAELSLEKILERKYHLRYPLHVLRKERLEYLAIAKRFGYPVLDTREDFEAVQAKIESLISALLRDRWGWAVAGGPDS